MVRQKTFYACIEDNHHEKNFKQSGKKRKEKENTKSVFQNVIKTVDVS